MSDSLITHKEHSHNTPLHYGYRKDFNDLLNSLFNGWLELPSESAVLRNMEPKIEVAENENDVTVCAELPGISEKDVDLEISSDGYLTLSGEKRQEKKEHSKGSYFSEISYGSFKRTVPLPWDLKFDNAKADFENGVLKVFIPKSQEEKGRKKKIAINRK